MRVINLTLNYIYIFLGGVIKILGVLIVGILMILGMLVLTGLNPFFIN